MTTVRSALLLLALSMPALQLLAQQVPKYAGNGDTQAPSGPLAKPPKPSNWPMPNGKPPGGMNDQVPDGSLNEKPGPSLSPQMQLLSVQTDAIKSLASRLDALEARVKQLEAEKKTRSPQ